MISVRNFTLKEMYYLGIFFIVSISCQTRLRDTVLVLLKWYPTVEPVETKPEKIKIIDKTNRNNFNG